MVIIMENGIVHTSSTHHGKLNRPPIMGKGIVHSSTLDEYVSVSILAKA